MNRIDTRVSWIGTNRAARRALSSLGLFALLASGACSGELGDFGQGFEGADDAESVASSPEAFVDDDAPLPPSFLDPPIPPEIVELVGYLKQAYPVVAGFLSIVNQGPNLADLIERSRVEIIDEMRAVRTAELVGTYEGLVDGHQRLVRNPMNSTEDAYLLWLQLTEIHLNQLATEIARNADQGYQLIKAFNVLGAMYLTVLKGSEASGFEPFDVMTQTDMIQKIKRVNYELIGSRTTFFENSAEGPHNTTAASPLWKTTRFAGSSSAGFCSWGPSQPITTCNLITGACSGCTQSHPSCPTATQRTTCLAEKRAQMARTFDLDPVVIAVREAQEELIRIHPASFDTVPTSPPLGKVSVGLQVPRLYESPLSVASIGNRVDVAYRSTTGQLKHLSWVDGKPGTQAGLSTELVEGIPAARSFGTDRFLSLYGTRNTPLVTSGVPTQIFAYDKAGADAVSSVGFRLSAQAGRSVNGGLILDSPQITPRGDVFAVVTGTDRAPWVASFDGTSWNGWHRQGGIFLTGSPVAIAPEVGAVDYFGVALDGSVSHGVFTHNGVGSESIGGQVGGLAAMSSGPKRLDVFGVGIDLSVQHRSRSINGWGPWRSLGGTVTSKPAVVAWSSGRLDVFVRGTDAGLWHNWCNDAGCDSGQWAGWEPMGGFLVGNPVVTSPAPGKLVVFVQQADNKLYRKTFDGSLGWQPSVLGYEQVASDVAAQPGNKAWWWNPGYYTHAFDAGNSRGFTGDSDWAVGDYKGQCKAGDRATGLSVNGGRAHSLLCADAGLKIGSGATSGIGKVESVFSLRGSGQRGTTSTGDWDAGFVKAECAGGSVLTGVAQTTDLKADAILCAPIQTQLAASGNTCNALTVVPWDNRASFSSSDWAPGFVKTECAVDQVMRGVSRDASGKVHAILCCNVAVFAP